MKKSKLLDIFLVIPVKEHRLFLEYVESPYFNKRKDVVLLCQYMIKTAKRSYPSRQIKSDHCWAQLFPNENFDKKEMAYLMSRLNQLAESFLAQQKFEKEEAVYPVVGLEVLAEKRLEKHYQQSLKKIKKNIASSSLEDANKIWIQYKIAEIEDFHFNLQNQRQTNPFLVQKNDFLDQFFRQKKIQLFCTIQNIKNVLGVDLKISWPQSPKLTKPEMGSTEVYKAYHSLYELLKQTDNLGAQFLNFKSLLPFLKDKLSHAEFLDMYAFAINYCLVKWNKGERVYAKHLLSLYEDGLEQGSLIVNNELSPWIYKNIVKLGLGFKRFKWTKDFILNYSDKLPKDQRKDAFYFNLADLNYYQKNYDEAFEYLNEVEFTDELYKYGSKIMLLKIYFEKNETEAFFALESSFRILLIRDKRLRSDIKTSYLNFIRFTAKLYKLKYNKDEQKLRKLRMKIKQSPNVNGRNWIIGQLEVLEGR